MARIQCNVISYILHRTVDMTIVLPTVTIPGCTKDAHHVYPHPYPVLYLSSGADTPILKDMLKNGRLP